MKKIKFCPNCGSTNIDLRPTVDQAAFGFNPTLKCSNCNFESIVFPEKEVEVNEQ